VPSDLLSERETCRILTAEPGDSRLPASLALCKITVGGKEMQISELMEDENIGGEAFATMSKAEYEYYQSLLEHLTPTLSPHDIEATFSAENVRKIFGDAVNFGTIATAEGHRNHDHIVQGNRRRLGTHPKQLCPVCLELVQVKQGDSHL